MNILLRTPLLAALLVLMAAVSADAKHPNIVFILCDDLGTGDPGCYNAESKIPTPNFDRVASQGMRFTDAHSPSAVCSPTRYGVLTGRYAWRSRLKQGVLWGYSRSLIEPGRMTVASLLKRHGFNTAAFGKWHLGFQSPDLNAKNLPPAHTVLPGDHPQAVDYAKPLRPGPVTVGFDHFFGIPASLDMEPYVFVQDDHPLEQPTETVKKSLHRRQGGGGFWRGGPIAPSFRHIDVLPKIGQQAVAWIGQQDTKQPFFLYLPLSAPHTPWLPTEQFRGKAQAGYYGDFVVQVDWVVGQVVDALQRKGLTDDTVLMITSDNGSNWPDPDIKKWGHDANMSYRGQKADIWEGGHRVPFIVRWPAKVQPGAVCQQTVCLTDLLATAADIVQDKLPAGAGEDSFSLLPALLDKQHSEPLRPATIHHSVNGTFAIRVGDWKLVEGNLGSGGFTNPKVVKPKPGGPQGQLYNLRNDPHETTNLYQSQPEQVERLSAMLEHYRREGRSR